MTEKFIKRTSLVRLDELTRAGHKMHENCYESRNTNLEIAAQGANWKLRRLDKWGAWSA